MALLPFAAGDVMKCSLCASKAIIYLSYSESFLCGKHLSRLVEKRAGNSMRRYGMIRGRKSIGVAVSGGKDSQSLLCIMHKLIGKDRGRKLSAVTVDEGIGGYRQNSIVKAKQLCGELGIEHHIFRFSELAVPMDSIMEGGKTDPCSYCGVFRRWVLNRASRELGLDALAIGHNLDDVVQTLQLNIMRNEPQRIARFTPNGGNADNPGFVPRIRPLFSIPEREIVAYALHNEIPFHNGECPYARYALRNPVRNFINDMEGKYPGIKFRMLNSYLSVLELGASPGYERMGACASCGEPSSSKTCKRCSFLSSLKRNI